MIIDKNILDDLTRRAQNSPRLRMNMDLRNTSEDKSQRMLNAIEPGTVMHIYRHMKSSETCICVKGHFVEYFYDEKGGCNRYYRHASRRHNPKYPDWSMAQLEIIGEWHRFV